MAKGKPLIRTAKGKRAGHYRAVVGKEKLLDGTIAEARFYLGKDKEDADIRKERLVLEWNRCEQQGYQWWPDEVLAKLVRDGVITRRRLKTNVASDMIGIVPKGSELSPFVNEDTGQIHPEYAPKILELIVQKIISQPNNQQRFALAFQEEFNRDPMSALERGSRVFGWTKGDLGVQFNVGISGGGTGTPLVFDASEERKRIKSVNVTDSDHRQAESATRTD